MSTAMLISASESALMPESVDPMNKNALLGGVLGVVSLAALNAGAAKPETRNRAEIPAQYKWDFTAIYPDWQAWKQR